MCKCSKKAAMGVGGCCFSLGAILPAVFFIIGETVIPNVVMTSIDDGLVWDSQKDLDENAPASGEWERNFTFDMIFFNCTNAYELQTVNPAPKPKFETVTVTVIEMPMKFDGEAASDGETYTFSEWSKYVPVHPADLDLEIVQVNPTYLGAIFALAPSEKMAFLGLAHEVLKIVRDQAMAGFAVGLTDTTTAAALVAGMDAVMNANGAPLGFVTNVFQAGELYSGLDAGTIANADAATSIANMGTAQFGMSTYSKLAQVGDAPHLTAQPLLASAGICTPPELNAYMPNALASPAIAGAAAAKGMSNLDFAMTFAQSQAFLDTFTSTISGVPAPAVLAQYASTWATAAEAAAVATAAGDAAAALAAAADMTGAESTINALFGSTFGTLTAEVGGVTGPVCDMSAAPANTSGCIVVALAYTDYLTSYLPEQLFVGCLLVGCADTSCLKADGTGVQNSGLFTRRSVRWILHGGDDPLFSAVPPAAVPDGLALEWQGLLGNASLHGASATLAGLRSAFALGEKNATLFSYTRKSGKTDLADISSIVQFQGETLLPSTHADYPGWGTNGRPGQPFDLRGLRALHQMPPSTKPRSSLGVMADGYEVEPDGFGANVTVYIRAVRRHATIGCGPGGLSSGGLSDCAFHDGGVTKAVKALKFAPPDGLFNLTVAGVASDTCGGTASSTYVAKMAALGQPTAKTAPTCDYLMRHRGVLNLELVRGAPMAVTAGYFHFTDFRDSVSITAPSSTAEIYYAAERDELAVFYEPLSGAAVAGYERLQSNFYVEGGMLDSLRYANVFSSAPLFLWPYAFVRRESSLEEKDADAFSQAVYGAYTLGAALDILGIVLFVVCFATGGLVCLLCVLRRPPGSTQSSTNEGSSPKWRVSGGKMKGPKDTSFA